MWTSNPVRSWPSTAIRTSKSAWCWPARRLFPCIGAESKTLQTGDMYRIPGGVRHKVIALEEPVKCLDIFCPIREDYL